MNTDSTMEIQAADMTPTDVTQGVKQSAFERLAAVNVNDHIEKKKDGNGNEMSYLSWAWAFDRLQRNCKEFRYEVIRYENNLPYIYDPQTGYLVTTRVTIDGVTREMWLPVMDGANKAMKAVPYTYKTKYGEKVVKAATMFDINTAIMRCLVKNIAAFGLGLYLYAGEDIPAEEQDNQIADLKETLQLALTEVRAAKDKDSLNEILSRYTMLYQNEKFQKEVRKVNDKLKKQV